MTKLKAEMFSAEALKKGAGCGMGDFLRSLDPADREIIEGALRNSALPGTFIREQLLNAGVENVPHISVIRYHRGEHCQCPAS